MENIPPPSAVCLRALCVCSLGGLSLYLRVHETTCIPFPSQAKPRQGSAGRPIYSTAEGRGGRDEHTGNYFLKDKQNHLSSPHLSVFLANFNWTWSTNEEHKFSTDT